MSRKEVEQYYSDARKLGIKEYKRSVSNGQNGYIPFLEGLIKNVEIGSKIDLGIVEIPLNKIKGTYTYSRSKAFACNFMPILSNLTEFADKWAALCEIHMEEGIRDPIKVYEYLNWFYVIEGNKRTSVLKYFNAYSITGKVTRLIPKMDKSDLNIVIYYEFLEFYKKTGINCIWFSKENSFETLLMFLEKFEFPGIDEINKYKYFANSIYQSFRKIYHEVGGGRLRATTGDAFLEYIKLYGIPVEISEQDLRAKLVMLITEIENIIKQDTVVIQTEPAVSNKNKLVSTISTFVKPNRKLKVAFVYSKTQKQSNWTYLHEIGRSHVDKAMDDLVETSFIDNVPEGMEAYEHIKTLAEQGNDIIFATNPSFIHATLKAALKYSNVRFLNCSETHSFKHVNTYFGRIFEPRFLLGIIAGSMTQTDILGYVGTYPFPGIICGINAFALGARLVNPRVKVKVVWTDVLNSSDISVDSDAYRLVQWGADFISHQNVLANRRFTKEFGLYSVIFDSEKKICKPSKYIAAPVWNWGVFYERIIKSILREPKLNFTDFFSSEPKVVNYWWGMDSGIVDLFYSNKLVPMETQKLLKLMKKMIIQNSYQPFTGPIYDQAGVLRIKRDKTANHDQIMQMDWFVDAVDSELPAFRKGSHYDLLMDLDN